MTDRDEQHLGRVINGFAKSVATKYRRGILDHGGHLPEKAGMLANAEAEALDLMVYLPTLREQLAATLDKLVAGDVEGGIVQLGRILGPTED